MKPSERNSLRDALNRAITLKETDAPDKAYNAGLVLIHMMEDVGILPDGFCIAGETHCGDVQ